MVLAVRTLEPGSSTDAEVDAFFEACTESYAQQTTAWRDALLAVGVDEPAYLGCVESGRLVGVLPAYRFTGPLGAVLNSVAQAGALGGVACLPDIDRDAVYGALLTGFVERARELSCATASLTTNPLWPDVDLCRAHLAPEYELANACLVLGLDEAFDDGGELSGVSSNVRRNLARVLAGPLRVDEHQTPANVDEWYAIHAERHGTIGATPLPKKLFEGALAHAVPRGKARYFFVREDGGRMIAGGLYVCHGSVADALMPSVSTVHAKLGANYLLALHSMKWAHANGYRHYNWQASPPGGGVYRFKKQWGSRDVPYHWLTRVTGDVRSFLASTPRDVGEAYRWHFVLPFDRIGPESGHGGPSTRSAAWRAREDTKA